MMYVTGYIWIPTPKCFVQLSQIYCEDRTIKRNEIDGGRQRLLHPCWQYICPLSAVGVARPLRLRTCPIFVGARSNGRSTMSGWQCRDVHVSVGGPCPPKSWGRNHPFKDGQSHLLGGRQSGLYCGGAKFLSVGWWSLSWGALKLAPTSGRPA